MLFVTITTAVILAGLLFTLRRNRRAGSRVEVFAPNSIGQSNSQSSPEPANLESAPTAVGYSGSTARMQIRAVILAAALFIAAIGAVLFAVSPTGDGDTLLDTPSLASGPTATAAAASQTQTAEAGATPEPEVPVAAIGVDFSRVRLPRLDIDAPIVTLGVDPDGTMQSPNNPTDVAWYNFSARPGELSNVVMAGHLDYVDYGPAVFYRLKDARIGDELELDLVDGSVARYRVLRVTTYDETTAPVLDIVGPTDVETVTLITCGGSFDPLSREYDKRVVLRAERIDEAALSN